MDLRSLIRLLTLLLGILYLDTVCQTDAEDARAYYARGIQEYFAAPAAEEAVVAPAARPAMTPRPRRAVGCGPTARYQRLLAARPWPCPAAPAPRARRWLWCAVLQV